jgi:hypothetical protein
MNTMTHGKKDQTSLHYCELSIIFRCDLERYCKFSLRHNCLLSPFKQLISRLRRPQRDSAPKAYSKSLVKPVLLPFNAKDFVQ